MSARMVDVCRLLRSANHRFICRGHYDTGGVSGSLRGSLVLTAIHSLRSLLRAVSQTVLLEAKESHHDEAWKGVGADSVPKDRW